MFKRGQKCPRLFLRRRMDRTGAMGSFTYAMAQFPRKYGSIIPPIYKQNHVENKLSAILFANGHFLLYLRTSAYWKKSYLAMLERIFQYSLVATFARCGTYSSSLAIICKNGLHLIIRYSSSHSQASLNEWQIAYEIDNIYLFAIISSLHLRMCIFCRIFAAEYECKDDKEIVMYMSAGG